MEIAAVFYGSTLTRPAELATQIDELIFNTKNSCGYIYLLCCTGKPFTGTTNHYCGEGVQRGESIATQASTDICKVLLVVAPVSQTAFDLVALRSWKSDSSRCGFRNTACYTLQEPSILAARAWLMVNSIQLTHDGRHRFVPSRRKPT